MAKGPSGRVVIVVEPELKRDLYVELARRDVTLKAWFVGQATRFLETSRQPQLFFASGDITGDRPQIRGDAPSSAEEDRE